MSYTHFTLGERKYLQQLLEGGLSFRKIAAALGRGPSSISREINRKEHLRRHGKRKVNRKANCNTIRPERTIPEWPEEIKLRLETGHYEGDTVQGKTGTGGILTFADRKTRYLFAARIESKSSEKTRKAIVRMLRGVDGKSISPDNGCEFAQFRELEKELKSPVYFAEPHKPRQRGTNESTNGLLRFYFPKGFDFRTLTDEHLQKVVDEFNGRPRKRLGRKSPSEVFF